jgi:hypothetical protein
MCDLSGTDLSDIDLSEGGFYNTNFSKAKLNGTKLFKADCRTADFSFAKLSHSKAFQTDFSDACFRGATMQTADFTRSLFIRAHLEVAQLNGSNLTDADFTGAWLTGASIFNATCVNTNFSEASLRHVEFYNTNCRRAVFDKALIKQTQFTKTFLAGAFLSTTPIPVFSQQNIYYYKVDDEIYIDIGDKTRRIPEWDYYFSDICSEELGPPRDSLDFRRLRLHYYSVRDFIEGMADDLYRYDNKTLTN